jgi:hypothetical protein
MSTRSFVFRTRRHTTARAPVSTINKRTRCHRRQMERWPAQRVGDLRQREARLHRESYDERVATLALLALTE